MFIHSKIDKLIEVKQNAISGMTVLQMATEMGMPLSTLNNIKNGIAKPSVDKLEVIARYFNVDMNYFFDIELKKKESETAGVKVIDATEYMFQKVEALIQENTKLKLKVEEYEKEQRKSYTLPDVQDYKVAEESIELKRNK